MRNDRPQPVVVFLIKTCICENISMNETESRPSAKGSRRHCLWYTFLLPFNYFFPSFFIL